MTSKKTSKPSPAAPTTITLRELAERWLEHLEAEGKAQATVRAYGHDLGKACGFLGGDTRLVDLTPDAVGTYFQSALVTHTWAGVPKAELTIRLSRRVLRRSLAWAEDEGLVERAPLPDIR